MYHICYPISITQVSVCCCSSTSLTYFCISVQEELEPPLAVFVQPLEKQEGAFIETKVWLSCRSTLTECQGRIAQ